MITENNDKNTKLLYYILQKLHVYYKHRITIPEGLSDAIQPVDADSDHRHLHAEESAKHPEHRLKTVVVQPIACAAHRVGKMCKKGIF